MKTKKGSIDISVGGLFDLGIRNETNSARYFVESSWNPINPHLEKGQNGPGFEPEGTV